MNDYGAYVLLAFTACIASAIVTRAFIPALQRIGAVADENSRTLHVGRIPRGGGAPLLLAAFCALAVLGFAIDPVVAAAAFITAAVSFIDDIRSLPTALRFGSHLAAAALISLSLPADALVLQGIAPQWIDRALTIVGLTWMMNLYNFMDGINGNAGVETVSISAGYLAVAGLAGHSAVHAPLAVAIGAATLGFLIWNLRTQALVFLGDAGSVPLGLLMGALMIDLAISGSWAPALILPAIFIGDATLTLVCRIARGETFWRPHKAHHYQRAAERLGAHLPVVLMIGLANVCLIGIALIGVEAPWTGLALAAITITGLFVALGRAAQSQS